MASKKAEAMKNDKLRQKAEARQKRLELLILAIAEKAGIDVDGLLADLEGKPIQRAEKPTPSEDEIPEPKPKRKKKTVPDEE